MILEKLAINKENLHPEFKRLINTRELTPAKEFIEKLLDKFEFKDKNYFEQFPTLNGFYARLWELFVRCLIYEEDLGVLATSTKKKAPDFIAVNKNGLKVCIEATIAAPEIRVTEHFEPFNQEITFSEFKKQYAPYIVERLAGPLVNKTLKHYERTEGMEDVPIIFALTDCHNEFSHFYNLYIFLDYVFGNNSSPSYGVDGQLNHTSNKIDCVISGKKSLPAFFDNKANKYVSAILFYPGSILEKFNRIGKSHNLGCHDVEIKVDGLMINYEDKEPTKFDMLVDSNYLELFSSGCTLVFNPFAYNRLDLDLFKNVIRIIDVDGEYHYDCVWKNFHPTIIRTETKLKNI